MSNPLPPAVPAIITTFEGEGEGEGVGPRASTSPSTDQTGSSSPPPPVVIVSDATPQPSVGLVEGTQLGSPVSEDEGGEVSPVQFVVWCWAGGSPVRLDPVYEPPPQHTIHTIQACLWSDRQSKQPSELN